MHISQGTQPGSGQNFGHLQQRLMLNDWMTSKFCKWFNLNVSQRTCYSRERRLDRFEIVQKFQIKYNENYLEEEVEMFSNVTG